MKVIVTACGDAMLLLGWRRRWWRPMLLLGSHQRRHSGVEEAQADRRAWKGQARLHRPACALSQAQELYSLQDRRCWVVEVQEVEAEVCIPARSHSDDLQTLAVGLQLEQGEQRLQARAACWCLASGSKLCVTTRDCFLSSDQVSCRS